MYRAEHVPDLGAVRKTSGKISKSRRTLAAAAAAVIVLGGSHQLSAATDTWTGATDNNWWMWTDWDTGIVPGPLDTALFNNAGNGHTVINLSTSVNAGNILFDTTGSAAYTLGTAPDLGTLILTAGGAITVNPTVTKNELFNSNILLGVDATTQGYSFINNSTTPGQTLTFAGNILGGFGGTAGTETLTIGGAGNGIISGGIFNGGANAVALTKTGAGLWTVTGTSSYGGATNVNAGSLNITGVVGSGGTFNVGNATSNAAVTINGGTLLANSGAPTIVVGNSAGNSGSLVLNSGGIVSNSELWISTAKGGYGGFTLNGGSATINSWLAVGRNGDQALLTLNGGTLTVNNNPITIGAFGGDSGTAVFTGGTANVNTGIFVGESGNGVMSVLGTAVANVTGNVQIGANPGSAGILNLVGGALIAPAVTPGGGPSTLNFNGGTLKARGASTGFLTGLTNAFVFPGGAIIDDGGNAITVGQSLLVAPDSGVSASGLTATGTGYSTAPLVQVTGGDGSGASAIATINSSGVITGIIITNPGTGYTIAPTFALVGGGGSGSISGTASLVSNAGGGLTKLGLGKLTLSGANTYTGSTIVTGGTLVADTTSNSTVINPASDLQLRGGAFQLLNTTGTASQVFNGLTVGVGANAVDVNNTFGSGTTTIDLTGGTSLGITRAAGGTVDFHATTGGPLNSTSAIILTGQANTAAGIIGGWATVNFGADWAANDGAGNIVAYTAYTNIAAQGGVIADGANTNVRLNTAGTSGSDTLGATTTTINTLMQNTATAATINTTGGTLRLGAAGGVLLPSTAAALTFGTAVDAGNLTAGGAANAAGELIFLNNSASAVTVNSTITNNGTGVVSLTKSGSGSLVLASSHNTYTGTTFLNGGVTNIAADASLGTTPGSPTPGLLTFNGGTLQFASAFDLSANRGINVIASGGGTIDTNTFNSNYAGIIAGTGPLTKIGTGTFTLTGANTYAGVTTVTAGTLQIGNGTTDGSIANSLAVVNNSTLLFNVASSQSYPRGITGGGTLNKIGPGTLTLTGGSTYSGNTNVNAGVLNLPGSFVTSGGFVVGNAAGTAETIVTGRIGANAGAPSVVVGNVGSSVAGLVINGGSLNTNSELWTSTAGGSYGAFTLNDGAATINSWLAIARGGDQGLLQMNGGLLTVNNQPATIGAGNGSSVGTVTAIGGVANFTRDLWIAETGTAFLNVLGTANVVSGIQVQLGRNGGSHGQVNLDGGTLTTPLVAPGGGTGLFNFNGGTLRASANNPTNGSFMAGLTNSYVYSGGAVIDDTGHTITIGQPLLAPPGNGVAAGTLGASGTGYFSPPLVVVTNNASDTTGAGATAIANINSSGVLTGITITNPGTNYTATPTFTLKGGGGSGSLSGAPALSTNLSGGFTKMGSGTVILSATNTFTGPTTITAGTLSLAATGSIATSQNIIAGDTQGHSGAIFDVTNVSGFTLASGQTLSGFGHVTGALAVGSGATVAPGIPVINGNLTTAGETWTGGGSTGATGGAFAWKLNVNDNAPGTQYTSGATNTDKSGANWDQLSVSTLALSASSANEFNIRIISIAPGTPSSAAFDPGKSYSWTAVNVASGTIPGFSPSDFHLDTSGFTNPKPSTPLGFFSVSSVIDGSFDDVVINYSPAPEPGSLSLLALGSGGLLLRRRRRVRPQAGTT